MIARMPVYLDDPHYGGLIFATPPFNLFTCFMIPVYACIKDRRRLRRINDLYCRLVYMPIAVILTLAFMAVNLCLLPFAYIMAIVHKINLLANPRTSKFSKIANERPGYDLLFFVILGLFILLFY